MSDDGTGTDNVNQGAPPPAQQPPAQPPAQQQQARVQVVQGDVLKTLTDAIAAIPEAVSRSVREATASQPPATPPAQQQSAPNPADKPKPPDPPAAKPESVRTRALRAWFGIPK